VEVVAIRKENLLRDMEKWLEPADYAVNKSPLLGTGLWFIGEDMTQKWLDVRNTLFRWMWLTGGIPGSGMFLLSSGRYY